jgi:hypothetical protein
MDSSSFEGADVIKWSAANDVRVVVLFICGNPGLVNYYSLFLSTISSSLPSAAVYGIGHLNHSTSIKAGDKVATLRDQVDHKIRFVDQLDQQYKFRESQTKLVLIAHSIGSWISLEVTFCSLSGGYPANDRLSGSQISTSCRRLASFPLPDYFTYAIK